MSKLKSIRELEMERSAQPNFGKGITVASGFDLGAKSPLDSRLTVKTIDERDAHVTGNRAYEGMLVYVEADKKTYQLVDNKWEEFGFNEEKFQDGILPITQKNDEQDERLDTLEGLVLGGEGEGIEAIISDVAQNKADIAELQSDVATKASQTDLTEGLQSVNDKIDAVEGKVDTNTGAIADLNSNLQSEVERAKKAEEAIKTELTEAIEDVNGANTALEARVSEAERDITKNAEDLAQEISNRDAAISAVNSKISDLDSAYKNADTTINNRLNALEEATADLEEIRSDIDTNAAAIAKEVEDRATAVSGVDSKIDAEIERATAAETALGQRIDGVVASVTQAIQTSKEYTDEKVSEINKANEELEKRVEANETALSTVDSRIATAKTEAVDLSKAYTKEEIEKVNAAFAEADVKVLEDAKTYTNETVQAAKTELEGSISAVDSKVTSLTERVSANETEISNIKDVLANKNSNTIVVETEDQISEANPEPKVGDLAYVISSKRAYIYKGEAALSTSLAPAGWMVFDEITSELDLVDYRKKSEKITEEDLESGLSTKVNNKADKSYVDEELAKKTNEAYVNAKVAEVVTPVQSESAQNKIDIAEEISTRESEISRVDQLITELEAAIEKANELSALLQSRLETLEDVEENRILFDDVM